MAGPVAHTLPSRVARRFSSWPSTWVRSGTSDLHFSYDHEIKFTLWGLTALGRSWAHLGTPGLPWAPLGSPARQAGASLPHRRAILPPLVASPTWLSRFGAFRKCSVKCFMSVIPEQLDINRVFAPICISNSAGKLEFEGMFWVPPLKQLDSF